MAISERLRILRNEQGITQQQLADQAGISRSNINTWESGKSLPLPDGLIALADCFGCSIDYLLGRESEEGTIAIKSDTQYSDEEQEFIKYYRKLSARQKFAALNFVKGMLAG